MNQYSSIKNFLLMQIAFSLFARCAVPVKDYIPGTYATTWSTEFTQARDTLLIEPPVEGGSTIYQITRRTYMLYLGKPKYKLTVWTGTFNSSDKTITVNNNGTIMSFDPLHHEMKMGSTVYKKL